MKRPSVIDYTKRNEIHVGDFKKACALYAAHLVENGAKAQTLFPDILHYVDGSGLTKKAEFIEAVNQYLDQLEASMNVKTKAERIQELRDKIAEIEKEHEGNHGLWKISPNGGSGETRTLIAVSENKGWLRNYCEQQFSYTPSDNGRRPETDKQFQSPYYTIQDSKVAIVLVNKIIS
jgi:hypothetical protein